MGLGSSVLSDELSCFRGVKRPALTIIFLVTGNTAKKIKQLSLIGLTDPLKPKNSTEYNVL